MAINLTIEGLCFRVIPMPDTEEVIDGTKRMNKIIEQHIAEMNKTRAELVKKSFEKKFKKPLTESEGRLILIIVSQPDGRRLYKYGGITFLIEFQAEHDYDKAMTTMRFQEMQS